MEAHQELIGADRKEVIRMTITFFLTLGVPMQRRGIRGTQMNLTSLDAVGTMVQLPYGQGRTVRSTNCGERTWVFPSGPCETCKNKTMIHCVKYLVVICKIILIYIGTSDKNSIGDDRL